MDRKVLEEEQRALLTEEQIQQYEKALALYQERADFVERLADLESVEIPAYQPRLQEISMLGEIPENNYKAPEYTVKKYVPASGPRPEFHAYAFHASGRAELPKCRKPAKVQLNYDPKVETVRPELPKAVNIETISVIFAFAEKKQPCLPEIAPPNVFEISFEEPGRAEAVLPEVEITCPNRKEYKKPDLTPDKVPAVEKPDYIVRSRKAGPVCNVLQELLGIRPSGTEYKKPEISETEIPKVLKPNVSDYEFVPAEYSVQDLPQSRKPETGFVQSGAGEISPIKYRLNSQKPELLVPEKISPANVTFRSVEMPEPKIKKVPVSVIRVRPFVKAESRAKELPEPAAVKIPMAMRY